MFHMFSVLAEFERNLIQERTKAGLDATRARGRSGLFQVESSSDIIQKDCNQGENI